MGDDYFQVIDGVKIETCDLDAIKNALPLLKRLRNLKYIILPSCGGTFEEPANDEISSLLKREFPKIELWDTGVIGR